jgi:outer membrane protein assembly factor BamB
VRNLRYSAGFALAALLLTAGPAAAAASDAAPASDSRAAVADTAWAQDGYGPGNTGYNAAESVVNAATIKKLTRRWTVTPQRGTEGCASPTTPVIGGGRMFVVDGDGVGAYDTGTGHRLWRDAGVMKARIGRTMTVAGGLVITSGWSCYGNSNPSGHLAGLDARTGKLRWQVQQGDAIGAVVADRGMVITYAECHACGTNSVTAYRASGGTRAWTYEEAITAPVSAAGRVLITGATTGSYAVAITTGKVLWRTPMRWSVLAANPTGDQFYATNPGGRLAAINAASGKILWSAAASNGIIADDGIDPAGSPVAADGRRVYLSHNGVTAYDAGNGKRLWHRSALPMSRPIRAGGVLYVAGKALSPATGVTVVPAGLGTPDHHVVVADGHLYANAAGVITSWAAAPR